MLARERSWLVSSLVANPWLKLLSVLSAAIIWLYVQEEQVHEARVKAQIAWTLPDALIATEPLPTTAVLTVRGTRSAARKAREAMIRMVVDVTDLGRGEHGIELGALAPEGLPGSVEVLSVQPASVRFVFDDVALRSVRLMPVLVGEPAEGFSVSEATVEPGVLEVRGARGAVAPLVEVQTRPVDVSGIAADALRNDVALELPRGVSAVGDAHIAVRLVVVSKVDQRRIDDVPLFVRGPAGWRADPETVSVLFEGPQRDLDALSADEVGAFVYLPEILDRSSYELWYGPESGGRISVVHPGDRVQALATTPPSVQVRRP